VREIYVCVRVGMYVGVRVCVVCSCVLLRFVWYVLLCGCEGVCVCERERE